MCEPVSATAGATTAAGAGGSMFTASQMMYASMAIAAATTAAQYASQQQQASAQSQYQQQMADENAKQMEQNAKLARESYYLSTARLDQQDMQKDAAHSQDMLANQIAGAKARATARVSAGEAGVSGLSVDSLVADFHRQEAMYRSSAENNRENERAQVQMEKQGLRAQADGRIQSVRPYVRDPISRPDFLGAALRVGAGGMDAISRYAPRDKDPMTGEARYRLG